MDSSLRKVAQCQTVQQLLDRISNRQHVRAFVFAADADYARAAYQRVCEQAERLGLMEGAHTSESNDCFEGNVTMGGARYVHITSHLPHRGLLKAEYFVLHGITELDPESEAALDEIIVSYSLQIDPNAPLTGTWPFPSGSAPTAGDD